MRRRNHPLFLFNNKLGNAMCYIFLNLSFCFSPQQVSVAPLCAAQASAGLCIPNIHCSSLCWREGAWWMGLFVSVFRFPHAAEPGSVRIQWQNGLPAQAWCSASQWQEVWPFLWQDRHGCGKHVDHKGRFTALLLLCFPHLTVRHMDPGICAN